MFQMTLERDCHIGAAAPPYKNKFGGACTACVGTRTTGARDGNGLCVAHKVAWAAVCGVHKRFHKMGNALYIIRVCARIFEAR